MELRKRGRIAIATVGLHQREKLPNWTNRHRESSVPWARCAAAHKLIAQKIFLSLALLPFYGNCICLRFLIGQLFNTYSSLFHRDHSTIASSRPSSSDPPGRNSDDSIAGTFRPPPRPLPYDDPRCSPLYRERSITVFSKGCSHCHEETEPLRCSVGDPNGDSTQVMAVGAAADEASKSGASQMQLKQWQSDVPYVFDSFEDEEVCPTCLEEYTVEDPKIILRCSHHFHLGCIYEWMERSEACPVCGKAMVFSERT